MPRSSRHRSKRSVKEGKEYYCSDTEEEVAKGKRKEGKVKDVSGYSSEEYVGTERRKERGEKVGSDRWNGLDLESEGREEREVFDGKAVKKDVKSKLSGGRHDVEGSVEVGKEEGFSGKGESKRRVEKEKVDRDLSRKDEYKVKDTKEKEKGSERDYKYVDRKLDLDYQAVDREEQKTKNGLESKDWSLEDEYGKHGAEKEADRQRKKRTGEYDDKEKYRDRDRDSRDMSRRDRVKDGTDRDERHKDATVRDKHYWPLEEAYENHGSEKERDTRRWKRTGESDDKDKYQESYKESSDINVTSVREWNKDGRYKDERHRDISSRDKNREYYDRDSKRDVEKREGTDRERSQKYDEYSDDRSSRGHVGSKNDSKYARDEFESLDSRQKKSRVDTSNFDSSASYDDQRPRYKDYKETRGSMDKQQYENMKSRDAKEYHDSTNKSVGAKEETVVDKELSLSFHPDESTAGQIQRKRSPSSTPLSSKDQYRHSKPSDLKYGKSMPDERSHSNPNYGKEGNNSGAYDRAHSSRALDKFVQKGDSDHVAHLSSERHRIADRHLSPVRLADNSQSPSSTERWHLSRVGDRRSHDYENYGHRSSGYKNPNYHYHDGKRSQDRKVDAHSGSSRSFRPPASPLKHGLDNSYAGSAEEDGRGKFNHLKRPVDSSMGRMQGNSWWGAPNWPSPLGNGYLPFTHGPGTVGFHPMMQQFPPQMFGVRPPMDHSGVPFHIPDGDRFPGYGRSYGWPNPGDETCPSPMPNWDSNNMHPGEGFTQGRTDWDQNKSLTASASREPSVDRYKGANSATMESPLGNRRANADPADDLSAQSNSGGHQVDISGNENQFGSKNSSGMPSPLKDISSRILNAKVSEEGNTIVDIDDHVHRSHVYLSMIDISPDLVPSDLFDHCVSLLKLGQCALSDKRRSRFSPEEEDVEGERPKMNTYISRRPAFTEVSESFYEKAMSIYRHHRDDTTVKYSSKQPIGLFHPTPEIQGSEPSLPAPSLLVESNDQELLCPGPPSEFPGSNINEDINTMPIIHPKLEAPSPMPCDTLDVNVSNQPEVGVNTFLTSEEVKEDLIMENTAGDVAENKETSYKTNTNMDEGTQIQSPSIITISNSEAKLEASEPGKNADDGDKATNDEQSAIEARATTGDTTSHSTANVHFEECEDTVMTELNEYGSVNLKRIH